MKGKKKRGGGPKDPGHSHEQLQKKAFAGCHAIHYFHLAREKGASPEMLRAIRDSSAELAREGFAAMAADAENEFSMGAASEQSLTATTQTKFGSLIVRLRILVDTINHVSVPRAIVIILLIHALSVATQTAPETLSGLLSGLKA